MPPKGGRLASPALTSGYLAQPMSSIRDLSAAPAFTSAWAAVYTYGQLTMNIPVLPWKAERASSSPAVDIAGGAAGDLESPPTISAAASPAGELIAGLAFLPAWGSAMISPPADMTRALIQTM